MHMVKLGNLFRGVKQSDEITSLKLERPSSSSERGPVAAKDAAEMLKTRQKQQAKFDQTPLAAVLQRCAEELMESNGHPDAMFYATRTGQCSPLGFVSPDKTKGMALIFTSRVLAYQLFQEKAFTSGNGAFEVRQFRLDEMEELARSWKSQGFSAFTLNMTAKKAAPVVIEARDGVITKELLLKAWAANRVSCSVLAEAWRAEYVGPWAEELCFKEKLKRQRTALENLRDMGAGDVPFVHWQLALVAGMQGDEPGRLAATAVLETFGPDFAGKTAPSVEDPKGWAESMSIATLGLMTEFGMLCGPDGKPVGSILKVMTGTAANPQ
jgi:hypothetical protein